MASQRCQACIESLRSARDAFASRGEEGQELLHATTDQLQRLSLWIGNIGGLQPAASPLSLESRLAEPAQDVLDHILQILDDIEEAASDLHATAKGEPQPSLGDEDEESDKETATIEEIGSYISRLFRASRLIRQAAPTDRFAKALSRKRVLFNNQFDLLHVAEKFPRLGTAENARLLYKLGQAITERRQYLHWTREHKNNLEKAAPVVEPRVDTKGPAVADRFAGLKVHDGSSRPSTFWTKASTLDPMKLNQEALRAEAEEEEDDDAKSYTTISRSVDGDMDTSLSHRIPKLEDLVKSPAAGSLLPNRARQEVECPYCNQIMNFKNEKVWRRHVYHDLRPYVCTSSECEAPYFGDINEWFKHEMQNHRVNYNCRLCQSKTYDDKARFLNHLRSKHGDVIPEGEEQSFVDIGKQTVQQVPATDCPCCSDWSARLRERLPSEDSEVLYVTLNVFKRHLASHLEQLALFALPLPVSGDDANSNAAVDDQVSDGQVSNVENPDEEAQALFIETKRYVRFITQVQTGANLLEILAKPVKPNDDEKWQSLLRSKFADGSNTEGTYSDAEMADTTRMSYYDLKRLTLENVMRLERMGRVSKHNFYQDILDAIAIDQDTRSDPLENDDSRGQPMMMNGQPMNQHPQILAAQMAQQQRVQQQMAAIQNGGMQGNVGGMQMTPQQRHQMMQVMQQNIMAQQQQIAQQQQQGGIANMQQHQLLQQMVHSYAQLQALQRQQSQGVKLSDPYLWSIEQGIVDQPGDLTIMAALFSAQARIPSTLDFAFRDITLADSRAKALLQMFSVSELVNVDGDTKRATVISPKGEEFIISKTGNVWNFLSNLPAQDKKDCTELVRSLEARGLSMVAIAGTFRGSWKLLGILPYTWISAKDESGDGPIDQTGPLIDTASGDDPVSSAAEETHGSLSAFSQPQLWKCCKCSFQWAPMSWDATCSNCEARVCKDCEFADDKPVAETGTTDTVSDAEIDGEDLTFPHQRGLFCEFRYITKCKEWFGFNDRDKWMEHMRRVHLPDRLPRRFGCILCHRAYIAKEDDGDLDENFRRRMDHVALHFEVMIRKGLSEQSHVDMSLLHFLRAENLIDDGTYLATLPNALQLLDFSPSSPMFYKDTHEILPDDAPLAAQTGSPAASERGVPLSNAETKDSLGEPMYPVLGGPGSLRNPQMLIEAFSRQHSDLLLPHDFMRRLRLLMPHVTTDDPEAEDSFSRAYSLFFEPSSTNNVNSERKLEPLLDQFYLAARTGNPGKSEDRPHVVDKATRHLQLFIQVLCEELEEDSPLLTRALRGLAERLQVELDSRAVLEGNSPPQQSHEESEAISTTEQPERVDDASKGNLSSASQQLQDSSSPKILHQTAYARFWYCCQCDFGRHSMNLPICTTRFCGHRRCTHCLIHEEVVRLDQDDHTVEPGSIPDQGEEASSAPEDIDEMNAPVEFIEVLDLRAKLRYAAQDQGPRAVDTMRLILDKGRPYLTRLEPSGFILDVFNNGVHGHSMLDLLLRMKEVQIPVDQASLLIIVSNTSVGHLILDICPPLSEPETQKAFTSKAVLRALRIHFKNSLIIGPDQLERMAKSLVSYLVRSAFSHVTFEVGALLESLCDTALDTSDIIDLLAPMIAIICVRLCQERGWLGFAISMQHRVIRFWADSRGEKSLEAIGQMLDLAGIMVDANRFQDARTVLLRANNLLPDDALGELATDPEADALQARCFYQFSILELVEGHDDLADHYLEQVLSTNRRIGAYDSLSSVMRVFPRVAFTRFDLAEAEHRISRLIRIVSERPTVDYSELIILSEARISLIARSGTRDEKVIQLGQDFLFLVDEHAALDSYQWGSLRDHVLYMVQLSLRKLGRLDEARDCLMGFSGVDENWDHAVVGLNFNNWASHVAQLAEEYRRAGDDGKAELLLLWAMRKYHNQGSTVEPPTSVLELTLQLGKLYASQKRYQEAESQLLEVVDLENWTCKIEAQRQPAFRCLAEVWAGMPSPSRLQTLRERVPEAFHYSAAELELGSRQEGS